MARSTSAYIHGTSGDEQDRLALMNDILNGRELSELALTGDERALEMGAGTGVFSRALARAVPRGSVVAIERDAEQHRVAVEHNSGVPNVEVRQGDAYDPPLAADEWGAFDLVHARFLLEHLERPLDAVRIMVRAVRPGGRIVLVDDDHSLMRLDPEPDGFLELWNRYALQYESLGMDPFVGRRLVALLEAAGARPVRTSMVFYGGCSNDPGFPAVVDNLVRVVESAKERMITAGGYSAGELDRILAGVRKWAAGTNRAVWYGLPLAEGTR